MESPFPSGQRPEAHTLAGRFKKTYTRVVYAAHLAGEWPFCRVTMATTSILVAWAHGHHAHAGFEAVLANDFDYIDVLSAISAPITVIHGARKFLSLCALAKEAPEVFSRWSIQQIDRKGAGQNCYI